MPRVRINLVAFLALQALFLIGAVWFIAGNDRLFRSTVPLEQRLISRHETLRKKAQQELLGMGMDAKKETAMRLIPALEGEDPFARKWAAISLALIGSAAQEAIPALLQSVSAKEKDVAQAARVALSEIGAPDAQQLPSLMKALQDPKESVRCEAALSIGKMGPAAQDALPDLLRHLTRNADSPVCFEESVASLLASTPAILPPVLDLLKHPEAPTHRKAAHVLAMARPRAPEVGAPLFMALLHEQDPKTRLWLSKALQLPYTPIAEQSDIWKAALQSDNPAVRMAAAREVRQTAPRGKQSLPLILKMMKDSDAAIRRLGLETLRRTGVRTPDVLRKVAKAQRDPDAGVRCRAAETLVESGDADRVSASLLIEDMRREDDIARCAQEVLGIASLFDSSIIRSMTKLVQEEKDPDIRSRAARVLMHLGPRAHEAVNALRRAQKDEVPGAAIALKAIRTPPPRRRR